MIRQSIIRSVGGAIALSGLLAGSASAQVGDLAERLPPGANAVAYINVEALLSSPLGTKENWRERMSDAYDTNALIVPPGTKHMLMASWLDLAHAEPLWEVSMIRLSKSITMDRIARAQNGYTEGFGEKMAAWTPLNAWFVRLGDGLLGVVSPADRQFAARWAGQSGGGGAALSPYLRAAVGAIGSDTDYLLAVDLGDAVSRKRVRERLAMDEFDCLAGKEIDAVKVSEFCASAKGLRLTVDVTSAIAGQCVIEFSEAASSVEPFAKPLLLEVLNNAGAALSDFDGWEVTTKGTSIHAKGSLTAEGLRQLCSVIDPPNPTGLEDEPRKPAGTGEAASASAEISAAAASQKYYRAIAKSIDGFGERARSASSLKAGATYIARDVRRLGRLPILNVDPELVQWGNFVNNRMIEVASALGVGGLQARARAESVAEPYMTTGGNPYDQDIGVNPNDNVELRNAARQRRAAVAEEKLKVVEQAGQIVKELEASRAEIRAKMTEKYKIEF